MDNELRQKIVEMHENGISPKEISEQLYVDISIVCSTLWGEGRLDEDQVNEIMDAHEEPKVTPTPQISNNLTVSYETAEKMKAAGWEKGTTFAYDDKGVLYIYNDVYWTNLDPYGTSGDIQKEFLEAPTFIEIWRELDMKCDIEDGHTITYKYNNHKALIVHMTWGLEAEAAAQMWLKGKEEGWIK
jgi:hypothetical protein